MGNTRIETQVRDCPTVQSLQNMQGSAAPQRLVVPSSVNLMGYLTLVNAYNHLVTACTITLDSRIYERSERIEIYNVQW